MSKNLRVTSNTATRRQIRETDVNSWMPSPKQKRVAEMLAMPLFDKYSKKDIIRAAGISSKTFYEWVKDKNFTDYVNRLVDEYDNIELREAWKALRKKVRSGDTAAIRTYFELKGKLNNNRLNVKTTVPTDEGDITVEVTLEDDDDGEE